MIAPFAGAGIEITEIILEKPLAHVAPFAGAGIEITPL